MIEFLIVGAGPVGLFTACLLAQAGRSVAVFERHLDPPAANRSIGIHPPALEALASIGVAERLIDAGVAIRRARVLVGGRKVGELTLERCPPPYRFVLSLPQGVTESLLAERLEVLAPGSLQRGSTVREVRLGAASVAVELADDTVWQAGFVIGCDGRASTVRASLGVPFSGRALSHHYLMADVRDTTDLGSDAAIFLGSRGVVESFPLPNEGRRWVARTSSRVTQPELEYLREIIRRRTGYSLPAEVGRPAPLHPAPIASVVVPHVRSANSSSEASPATSHDPRDRWPVVSEGTPSGFTPENRLAASLAGNRWALAGDAAHVVSPIGGQGMNLGLLGAEELVARLLAPSGWHPGRYDARQRRRARVASRRAALNMALGSERIGLLARNLALRAILLPAAAGRAGRFFTMRGL